MATVTLSTHLPISAGSARALAVKPELFRFVVAPVIVIRRLDVPDRIDAGVEVTARIWWFGIIPAWIHRLRIVSLGAHEIYTNETSGPVATWNHRLTFTPTTEGSCTYTDEVEVDDGVRGWPVRVFIAVMFRYRHRRWRQLARVLS